MLFFSLPYSGDEDGPCIDIDLSYRSAVHFCDLQKLQQLRLIRLHDMRNGNDDKSRLGKYMNSEFLISFNYLDNLVVMMGMKRFERRSRHLVHKDHVSSYRIK
jgi:hypothetical protein